MTLRCLSRLQANYQETHHRNRRLLKMIILDVQIVEGKKSTIVKNPHVTYTYIQSRQWIALHELIV